MVFLHVVGIHESAGFVEAAGRRTCVRLISDVPFPEDRGGIPCAPQDLSNRGKLRIDPSRIGAVRGEYGLTSESRV